MLELDEDGYPTEETINKIREWPITSFEDCQNLLEAIRPIWRWKEYIDENSPGVWFVSTGGWSGHEEIIDNLHPVFMKLCHKAWRVGGHYIFITKSGYTIRWDDKKMIRMVK